MPELVGPRHEGVEVLDRAEVGVDRVVAALGASRSPTASRRRPARGSGCCSGPCGWSCRSGGSAAGRRRRSPSRRPRAAAPWRSGTCPDRSTPSLGPARRPRSAGRTRTSCRRAPARGRPTAASGRCAVTKSRSGCSARVARTSGASAAASRAGTGRERVAQRGRGVEQRAAAGRRSGRRGGPLEHPGALLEHQLDVDAGRDLDLGVVVPGGDRVAPRLDREVQRPSLVGRDLGRPAVGARRARRHRREGALAALGVAQHDVGADHVVALAEDGRARP